MIANNQRFYTRSQEEAHKIAPERDIGLLSGSCSYTSDVSDD